MALFGIQMTLLIGPTVPVPAPREVTESIDRVEVSQNSSSRSGFQIVFRAGRAGLLGLADYAIAAHPLLKPGNRAVIVAVVRGIPRVLMDGFVTHAELNPGSSPGAGTFTVTGEDISVAMDRDVVTAEHPAQNEMIIALKLVAKYAQYGLIPEILPPFMIDFPLPTERIPVQRATDLKYLEQLAARFGYVFYVKPGPAPLTNTAYFGPPVRAGLPAKALSANLGGDSNLENIDFRYDELAAARVEDRIRDRSLNQDLPVVTFASTRVPPLAAFPALPFDLPNVRKVKLDHPEGLSFAQAYARAQATTNASMDSVLTATGEVDGARYGDILEARGLVGVRGVGYLHDGLYCVKTVKHTLAPGRYRQSFTLEREGRGSTVPVVRP